MRGRKLNVVISLDVVVGAAVVAVSDVWRLLRFVDVSFFDWE